MQTNLTPEQDAWEDRCRDCDDTGITIQTERRCACQPPLPQTNPEQWAVELWRSASAQGAKAWYDTPGYPSAKTSAEDAAAALAIQSAFAEREARLVGALTDVGASLTAAISLLERGGKAAKKAAPSDCMFDQMVKDYSASLERARATLAALKDRTDG